MSDFRVENGWAIFNDKYSKIAVPLRCIVSVVLPHDQKEDGEIYYGTHESDVWFVPRGAAENVLAIDFGGAHQAKGMGASDAEELRLLRALKRASDKYTANLSDECLHECKKIRDELEAFLLRKEGNP